LAASARPSPIATVMRIAASCPCSQDETAGQRVTWAADIFDRHIERSRISLLLQPRNGGSIIFTSTFVDYTARMPGTAAYAASKAGNHRPDPGPCRRARPEGTRVNAI
jgi:NAD(P)-dependent dehydrogenase (short-subunit alcohol dehydrogenase family)